MCKLMVFAQMHIPLEVRSKKIKYYEQYPQMIGELAEIASGLIYE